MRTVSSHVIDSPTDTAGRREGGYLTLNQKFDFTKNNFGAIGYDIPQPIITYA